MTLSKLVQKSLSPLIYISLIGMVASGAWLVSLGMMFKIWIPVLILVFAPFILPALMIPAAFAAGIMRVVEQVYPRLSKAMGFLSIAYLVTLLSLYGAGVFYCVAGIPALLPAAVFAVTGSTAPWFILAAKDRENVFFTGLVIMMTLTAIALVGLILTVHVAAFWGQFFVFWYILGAMVMLQALYEKLFLENGAPAATSTP